MSSSNNMLDGMRERLFSMLESEGITQKEFSERLGVSNQTITDWKKGKSRTFTQKLPLIASVLHCDLNWLVDGSGSSKPENADETFDRLLGIAHESRFIKYDGTHISSTPVGEEKKPAAEDGSGSDVYEKLAKMLLEQGIDVGTLSDAQLQRLAKIIAAALEQ